MNQRLVFIVGSVVAAALFIFAIWHATQRKADQPAPRPQASVPATPPPTETQDAEHANVPRIELDDLYAHFKAGDVTIIDVRDADAFVASHIPGALQIPLARIDGEVSYLPKGKPIVTYCTWPNEESSAGAVLVLQHGGITNAKALHGGFRAWVERGYPTASGEK